MDNWLTVKDFSVHYNIPEATIRSWLKRNLFTVSMEVVANRQVKSIVLDEKAKKILASYLNVPINTVNLSDLTMSKNDGNIDFHNEDNEQVETIKDVELVSDSHNYQLVSMENTTFEQLIQDIKELANDRSKSEKEAYQRLEKEYFELKSLRSQLEKSISQLRDENKDLAITLAQSETNLKIFEFKIQEYEEKLKIQKIEIEEKLIKEHKYELEALLKENKQLEEKLSKYEDQEDKIKHIEQQLNNSPWWSKKL